MKPRLIADENISWRIKRSLPTWDVLPVNEIAPSQRLSDMEIWRFAKSNDYTILTFDEDFIDIYNLYSFQPKIIWLRTGNISTSSIAFRLLNLEQNIVDFMLNEELGIFEIYL